MMNIPAAPAPEIDPQALHFLPLGGVGEIGMNLSLYACRGKWLMVDLGITFSGNSLPGVDIVVPDVSFIEKRREDLLAIVLTHGHEDHLGAVAYLWPQLQCPVYATPFTAALLREKLREAGLLKKVPLKEIPLCAKFELGPFSIQYVSVTHSIPEANSLILRTPDGTVLHTGDWKLDPEPLIGGVTDEDAFRGVGDEGVLAMMGDSTNALSEGESGSEASVRKKLIELVAACQQGVAVAQFASNVARLASVAEAARENGRELVLLGRSLWRYAKAAQATGYLDPEMRLLSDKDGASLHPRQVLYLCTGCQGEPRAAMSKIASRNHPRIHLSSGDCVIFTSKIIPGNEAPIGKMHSQLSARGIEVITETDHKDIHVSGHPRREELKRLYGWVKPRIAVPVHGEARHLAAHAELARSAGIDESWVMVNGEILRLAPGAPEIIGSVHSGRYAVDGSRLIAPDHTAFGARRRLMQNGAVFVSLVVDKDGWLIAPPVITGHGMVDAEEEKVVVEGLVKAVRDALESDTLENDDKKLREAGRLAVRRTLVALYDKRPIIEVQLVRV
jgi:ribonuclease J